MTQGFNIRRFLKLFAGTACAGALIFGATFYFMSIGGAFNEFQNWCMKSQGLAAVIGKFEKAELLLFSSGSFQIDKGNDGSAAFNARVIGTNGNIVVDVMMTKSNDIWLVDQVLTSGRPVDTKNTK